MTLPSFLIIGAQKAGTTFLFGLLRNHSRIKAPNKKELHFFDTARWHEGMEFYAEQFPALGENSVTGEASPYYMFCPRVAQRVAGTLPQAKLIVLLRNPVDRAYSDYRHKVRSGNEELGFEAAIEAEPARIAGEREKMLANDRYYSRALRRYSYLSRGVYVDQLREWHEHFDPGQMLVLNSEDLYEDPQGVSAKVLDSLDLPREPLATRSYGYGGEAEPMQAETRERLEAYFSPHNQRLYEYLGRDFGW